MSKAITIIAPDEFNYEDFSEPERDWLRGRAAFIHARLGITHHLITEMGAVFLEVKERLEPSGRFLAWTRTEFGLSDDTIENYMKVARNLPFLSETAAGVATAKALYKLAADDADPKGVGIALDKLNAGQPVDYGEAYILSRAPVHIREKFLNQEIPKQQAHDATKAIVRRGTPDEVRDFCIEKGVVHAAIVDYLSEAYNDEVKQADWKNPRKAWSAIVEDNGVLNGLGWSIPLKEANDRDLSRYIADRAVMHKDIANEAYDWKVTRAHVVQNAAGDVFLRVSKKDADLIQYKDRDLLVHVRVPVQKTPTK